MLPLRAVRPTSSFPAITLLLMAVCVAVYVFAQPNNVIGSTDAEEEQLFYLQWAAIPCEIVQGQPLTWFEEVQGTCGRAGDGEATFEGLPEWTTAEIHPDKNIWAAAGSSLFFHADLWHLFGNLLFLFVFGRIVEDRIGMISFLAAYLMFGAAALATHVIFNMDSVVPVIGASGAIAGLMGMFLVMWPRTNILTLAVYTVIPIPAWILLAAWLGLQFLFTDDSGIAYEAHIGGFLTGVLVGFVIRAVRPRDDGEEDADAAVVNPYLGR